MIIEICDSLALDLQNLTDEEHGALIGLALSRSRGYNFILSSKSLLHALISLNDIGALAISTYRKVYSDQVQWRNLLSSFNFRVRVVSSGQQISIHSEGSVEILQIPLKDILFYKLDDRASLIAENLTDIEFYVRISKSYLDYRKVVIGLCYNEVNGGGHTTKDVVSSHFKNNNGVSLCILDSDFKTPWCEYGDTAKGVIDIIPNFPFARYITTKSREAENIIPTIILDYFASENKLIRQSVSKIKQLIDDHDRNPVKFIDFKKGMRLKIIKTSCQDTNKFWSDSFIKAGLLKACNQSNDCQTIKTCKCSLIDGLGTDLLKCAVKYLEKEKFDFNDIDEYLKSEWIFLCESIIPYIVSPPRKAS